MYYNHSYLSLDPNERSNWKARELKSVFVEARAQFLKFLVFKNHINAINLFNQVGVVAINILGAAVPSQLPNAAQAAIDDIGIDMQLDAVTAAQIRQLHAEKVRASTAGVFIRRFLFFFVFFSSSSS